MTGSDSSAIGWQGGLAVPLTGVQPDSRIIVRPRQTVSGLVLSSGTLLDVEYKANALDITVLSGAEEWLDAAFASGSMVSGGAQLLDTYGSATGVTVASGGLVVVSNGVVNGATLAAGGVLALMDGATTSNITAAAGALVISAGTVITNPDGSLVVAQGGTLASAQPVSGKAEVFGAGAVAEGLDIVKGGTVIVHSGAVASGLQIGGHATSGGGTALSGAFVDGLQVSSGSFIESGATIADVVIGDGGYVYLSRNLSPAVQSGITVLSGGLLSSFAAPVAGLTVSAGGSAMVADVTGLTIRHGGSVFALSDTLSDVSAAGMLEDDNATLSNVTIRAGGLMRLLGGGSGSAVVISGGQAIYANYYDSANAAVELRSGAVGLVLAGTTAYDPIVDAGAVLYVFSGATLSGASGAGLIQQVTGDIMQGGSLVSAVSGTVSGLAVGRNQSATIGQGTTLIDPRIAGRADVTSAVVSGVQVRQHGVLGAAFTVLHGGAVQAGGTIDLTSATAVGVLVAGTEYLANGGTVHHATIKGGGTLFLGNAGGSAAAYDVTVQAGGLEHLEDTGTTSATLIQNGGKQLVSGGTDLSTTILSGGLLLDIADRTVVQGATLQAGGTIGFTFRNAASASISFDSATGVLSGTEPNAENYTVQLSGSYANDSFLVTSGPLPNELLVTLASASQSPHDASPVAGGGLMLPHQPAPVVDLLAHIV